MRLKSCDSCGGALVDSRGGSDVFFVVRLAITKATAWTPDEQARAEQILKLEGASSRLGKTLAEMEPAEIVGDRVPSLMKHADLRICAYCVQGRPNPSAAFVPGINLIDIIRATEIGADRVPTPKTA